MSTIHVTPQEMSILYTTVYCVYAAGVILIYDWLLCLGQEVRFIWNWRPGVSVVSLLLYALSRYALLISRLLSIATNYPMSDLSCMVNVWLQTITNILATIAFSVFSALRAYALSNRNIWLTAIIIFWALPPTAMNILQCIYAHPANLPSPFNCSWSVTLSPTLSLSITIVARASQLTAELLVVGITWWYSYQSYRLRKGINLGKTVSSLLIYNGSLYFLFLASLYIINVIFRTVSVPDAVLNADSFLVLFFDPIASILTCRFMLSLRQFDNQEHKASTVLQFGAQPSDSLPAFIASFAHPVHVDSALSDTEPDAIVDDGSEWREMDVVAPTRTTPSYQSTGPAPNQASNFKLEHAM